MHDKIISGGEDWSLRVRDPSTGIELRRVTQQGVEHVSQDGKLYFLTDIQGNGEVRSLRTNDTVLRTQVTRRAGAGAGAVDGAEFDHSFIRLSHTLVCRWSPTCLFCDASLRSPPATGSRNFLQ